MLFYPNHVTELDSDVCHENYGVAINKTPSLWRDFVWTDYKLYEVQYLCNVRVCGVHIRRLLLPQKLIQPNGSHKVTHGCVTI